MKRHGRPGSRETRRDTDKAFRQTIEMQRHGTSEPDAASPMWKRTPEVLVVLAIVILAWAKAGYVLGTIAP